MINYKEMYKLYIIKFGMQDLDKINSWCVLQSDDKYSESLNPCSMTIKELPFH
jgi:hypothetical protein